MLLDRHRHAALLGQCRSVDERDSLIAAGGEHTAQCSQSEDVDGFGRQLAGGDNLHGLHSFRRQRRSEETELADQLEPRSNFFAHGAAGDVDSLGNEFACQSEENTLRHVDACAVLSLGRRCSEVRGDNDVVELEELGIGARLGAEHVETGAADLAETSAS